MMKRLLLAVLILAFAWNAQTASAETLRFDFQSVSNSSIKFFGTDKKIEFPNKSSFDFTISDFDPDSSDTPHTLGGLFGNIEGTFQVGPISTTFGGDEVASVTTKVGTPTPIFSVSDGVNTLKAELDWQEITVYQNRLFGGLNAAGTTNLRNITYTGNHPDLCAIKAGIDPTVIVTFQILPAKKLSNLMTNGAVYSTSYSGSFIMSVVPEPASFGLLVMAALSLLGYAWSRRRS